MQKGNIHSPVLVAIVNSYNRLDLLRNAMSSLVHALEDLQVCSTVVVFDAGSTDGSRQWLEEFTNDQHRIPVHRVYPKFGDDTSFSAGVNAAWEYVIERFNGVRYLLLFETDNWLSNSAPILDGIALLEHETHLGVVGFTVEKYSGASAGYGCSFPSLFEFLLGPQFASLLRVDQLALPTWRHYGTSRWALCEVIFTSPVLIKVDAWKQSHGLDAVIFPYSECDVDWCWRLKKLGWSVGVLDCKGVVHDNQHNPSAWSVLRVVSLHRARLRLLERHRASWVGWLKPLLLLRHVVEFVALALLYAVGRKPKHSLTKRWMLMRTVFRGYTVK
jgi:GT2 family glycosyltransferase